MACGTGHRAELLLHLCEPVDRLDVVFILKVSLEPGTLGLLAVGLVGLGAGRRRLRR